MSVLSLSLCLSFFGVLDMGVCLQDGYKLGDSPAACSFPGGGDSCLNSHPEDHSRRRRRRRRRRKEEETEQANSPRPGDCQHTMGRSYQVKRKRKEEEKKRGASVRVGLEAGGRVLLYIHSVEVVLLFLRGLSCRALLSVLIRR